MQCISWFKVVVNFAIADSNTMKICVKVFSELLPFPTLLLGGREAYSHANSPFLIAARRAERNHREDKGDGTKQWALL